MRRRPEHSTYSGEIEPIRPRATTVACLALLATTLGIAIAPSAGEAHRGPNVLWTARQAQTIPTVRSLPVNVRECRGLGGVATREGVQRFRHFRCLAGTRAPWEHYDTIAVQYTLHPLGAYRAERPRYEVTAVRFIGGPGIP